MAGPDVFAEGTPEQIAKNDRSHTGRYLRDVLESATSDRKIPVVDMFTWKIQKSLEMGEDPYTVAETTLPTLVAWKAPSG